MKKQTLAELERRENSIRDQLTKDIGSSTIDLVNELIEVSLLLEQESNQ